MKKFSYICEFMRKDPQNPGKSLSIERHLFVFIVHVEAKEKPKVSNRLIKEWDPFGSEDEEK